MKRELSPSGLRLSIAWSQLRRSDRRHYHAQDGPPCQRAPISETPAMSRKLAAIDTTLQGIHSGIAARRNRLGSDASSIKHPEISKTITSTGTDTKAIPGSITSSIRAKGPPHGSERPLTNMAAATIDRIMARARRSARGVTVNINIRPTTHAAGEPNIQNSRVPPGTVLRAQMASATSAATSTSTE